MNDLIALQHAHAALQSAYAFLHVADYQFTGENVLALAASIKKEIDAMENANA